MPKIKMQATEYAKLKGVSKQAVTQALRLREEGKTHSLPGVTKVEKFSRFYLLTVTVDDDGKLVG